MLALQFACKDKSKWTFRVRFVGCGPDEDAWLLFAETNPLSALDKYPDEHPDSELGFRGLRRGM